MKPTSQDLLDQIEQPKTINARATFRQTRPQFAVSNLSNPYSLANANIDSCNYGTGILRVGAVNNLLYTQVVPDVLQEWPMWVNTGIALRSGSRPGVDDGYIWYQRPDGAICRRHISSMSSETVCRTGETNAVRIAPISNARCYYAYTASGITYLKWTDGANVNGAAWTGRIYSGGELVLDAVAYSEGTDYLYTVDRNARRIMEIKVQGYTPAARHFGKPKPIIAVDAIDDLYGFTFYGASMINGKVVITARMTRTSDSDPVSMDVYLVGPENFSLGRDMYISPSAIGGKMLLVSSQLLVSGAARQGQAIATRLFGVDSEALKLTTSDIGNVALQEAENRSSVLRLSLSPSLSHPAISNGSQVELEVAYNDHWMRAFTGEVSRIVRWKGEGEEISVEAASITVKRLSQWAPEQGIWIPSQAFANAGASDLSQVVRSDGKFEGYVDEDTSGGIENNQLTYTGGWTSGIPAHIYDQRRVVEEMDAEGSVSFTFTGTNFVFHHTLSPSRGVYRVYVDGVFQGYHNMWSPTTGTGTYTSGMFARGFHTVKFVCQPVMPYKPGGAYSPATNSPYWIMTAGAWQAGSSGSGTGVETNQYGAALVGWATFTNFTVGLKHDLASYFTTAEIYVDGVKIATVNTFDTSGYWSSPTFPQGTHRIEIRHADPLLRKLWVTSVDFYGGAQTAFYVDVDKVDVFSVADFDTEAAIRPKNLNRLSVLYTAARSAPGGIMRARLYNGTTGNPTVANPRFGVGLNYRRESKVEAASRLQMDYSDVADEMCGHNGIVAIYGQREVSNAPGIVLYRWQNSALTSLASFAVTLPQGLLWLQMSYTDGAIRVSWRTDTASTWTTLLTHSLSVSPSWTSDEGGHGCVVMERRSVIASTCQALSSQDDTLGIQSNAAFPTSGKVIVDNEIIAYSAKSPNTSVGEDVPIRYSGTMRPDPAYTTGDRMVVHATWTYNNNDPAIVGMAVLPYTATSDGSRLFSRTFRLAAYDRQCPLMWFPNAENFTAGWPMHVDDPTRGVWVDVATGKEKGLYLLPHGIGMPISEMEVFNQNYDHKVCLLPALHISKRGDNGTVATSHGATSVIYYVDIDLWVDRVQFFSEDEDISLSDALRHVIHLAGGQFSDKKAIDVVQAVPSASTWTYVPFSLTKPDFVAEMALPTNITNANARVGMLFRFSGPVNSGAGYMLGFQNSNLTLWRMPSGQVIESISGLVSGIPAGVIKVSVHGSRMAVWVNHRLIHVFINDEFTSGNYAGFTVYNPDHAAVPDLTCQVSELNDLMADITVGIRGRGMSVVSEMTGNRRVNFRCDPDGGMYFYKTRTPVGQLPDIVIAEERSDADEQVTRVRVEGIKVVEVADFDAMKQYGSVFETANSRWADTVSDLLNDGQYYMTTQKQAANARNYEVVYHPALQPGDRAEMVVDGEGIEVGITSTTVSFGIKDMDLSVDASIGACLHE